MSELFWSNFFFVSNLIFLWYEILCIHKRISRGEWPEVEERELGCCCYCLPGREGNVAETVQVGH